MGMKRKDRKYIQHDACCFNINHMIGVSQHHLYVLDVAAGEDPPKQSAPARESITTQDKPVQQNDMPTVIKRKRPQYLDRHQQLELALAAQELFELGDPDSSLTGSDEEDQRETRMGCMDIWHDVDCLMLLKEGVLTNTANLDEKRKIRRRATNYCWKEQKPFFKDLLVPRPEERLPLVTQMHEDIGHFDEHRTLAEIRRRYFWHNRTTDVKAMVRECQ
ncbi:unnamed protein product [Sphagnum jensenii]|uniref:Integrase zinc-binding domain-containing protein n=1 Tax=Sphagnum jensenii TaxID=128206 RepID=A0ABP1A3A0_9BRYO